jgi:hypothetical protein
MAAAAGFSDATIKPEPTSEQSVNAVSHQSNSLAAHVDIDINQPGLKTIASFILKSNAM